MKTKIDRYSIVFSTLLAFSLFLTGVAQQPEKPPPQKPDIVRVSTELAQTSVTVLDKQNQFVAGLKPEQFELRVDGRAATITFVEHVAMNANRTIANASANTATKAPTLADATARGRTIIFFVDDLHLSSAGVGKTRKALLDFVEQEMGPEDQVAIASPSGQIGFLQSFTEVKPVLRVAISRIHERPVVLPDTENIPMTEYEAIRIDQGDRDAIEYYAIELLKATNFSINGAGTLGPPAGGPATTVAPRGGRTGGMTREMAERNVKNRAQFLLRQSAAISINTLSTLEGLMRSASDRPGRKLLFMISDGFYLNDRNTGFAERLRQITDAATRAGVVIYTMDSKGLAGVTDASSNRADGDGRLARTNVGARTGLQDPLTAMAANTGGRAFLDSDAITTGLDTALSETSNYYVLAWRPPVDEQKGGKYKELEISIVGRPDLTVRMPRGFLVGESPANATTEPAAKPAETQPAETAKVNANPLASALRAASPKRGLPTQLATSFLDVPNTGLVLTASTQIATDVLGYGEDQKETAAVDLAGVVLDDQGKQAGSFKTRITVEPVTRAMDHPGVIYTHKLPLKPGLYQIRVAAQDERSGRVGSAMQWIEIPDLSQKRLTLSSLLVGGQFVGSQDQTAGGSQGQVQFSVDRRFRRGSHMNFMMFIYNAAKRPNANPQIDAQIIISRNGQQVLSSPVRQVAIEPGGDTARIIHGANIALQTLPAGRYLLEVRISDRVADTSANQQVMFEIE
jgi:VWFA-related protein